ncbi:hypothetical protein ACHQM5_003850 [Ranunculus cassubicifolius]
MLLKLLCFLFLLISSSSALGFVYNGFQNANLSLDGIAEIASNGLLKLTNGTKQQKGHAFYANPFRFKKAQNTSAFSFSTTFVFAIVPEYPESSGHGITFFLAPSKNLSETLPSQFLGLFNRTSNGNSSNHILAVELDTILSSEFYDTDNNHIGIDINDLRSVISAPVSYCPDEFPGVHNTLRLISGERMQVWIEYNGPEKLLNVTIAPLHLPKPRIPLLSLHRDISPVLLESMYVGFSSSTGSRKTLHYILGWSFQLDGKEQELDLSHLPRLPRKRKEQSKILTIELQVILSVLVVSMILVVILLIKRKRKFAEVFEDWETKYGAYRFSYKQLYIATKGFKDTELIAVGIFGRVYRGKLPTSNMEVAVRRVAHESRRDIREFIAEIASIGKLRHQNLVQLLGYCRRKGKIFLVYEYMPNGSLDKTLFDPQGPILGWNQRFRIMKGVASGLLYLHDQRATVVLHRDIKASNVLLDGEFNGKLGNFGLALLYDHRTNPQTTHIVGTPGYLAPEMSRTGKATTSTDIYAFGTFLLEVACGRRPIEMLTSGENQLLVDWVTSCWGKGDILETSDPKLGIDFVKKEMEVVLKLGLLCCHSLATSRPSIRQAVLILDGEMQLTE